MTSYESIIGQALFSGDHDKGIARAAVKMAVQTRMVCKCGAILDQRTAVYIETPSEKPAGVGCPDCVNTQLAGLPEGCAYLKYTWEGLERVNC